MSSLPFLSSLPTTLVAYGMSECAPMTHNQPWHLWSTAVGSIGTLVPNMRQKFVDLATGRELAPGETGELYLSGPNVMLGYLNIADSSITPDGYYPTGDVGHVDENGNVYITDRVKELIKYKGFPVAPAELEGLLVSNELVEDCAVVGVWDEEIASEVPRAYVVLKKGVEQVAEKEMERRIVEWTRGKVAPHKRLRGGVRVVESIPKSISGKILRREMRDRAKEEAEKERGVAKERWVTKGRL
jgi:4-coumarate--CoA ligase